MDDMRERLVELLKSTPHVGMSDGVGEMVTDHLIANGVIVPPCKVGQALWFIRTNGSNAKIIETDVEKIVLKHGGLYIKLSCNAMYETSCNSIGKTVFLTREEAEKEIKESDNNGE